MRKTLVAILLLSLGGCTNSPVIWKALYGQFDNLMKREILAYADFTPDQKQAIRSAVDKTVLWHRTQALPQYAQLLETASTRLIEGSPTREDIDWLYATGLDLGREFESQSPILQLTSLIQGLSDQQIQQAIEHIDEQLAEQQRELEASASKDPAEESTKLLAKSLRRLGLNLTKPQKQAVTQSFRQRNITEAMRYSAWQNWADEFKGILEGRNDNGFEEKITRHYTGRMTLIQRTYPEFWSNDQVQSKAMVLELLLSLDQGQKNKALDRFNLLQQVMQDLARE